MYSTCMFCAKPLGSNEVVEAFPVGRRLAFDEARGRLWVVCRKCERWNLSPLEERWEAVEACERIFRSTRVRVSSENVGLARHPEGLQLVRIGRPLRPEFAAWRYGDQFGRRRRKHVLYGVGAGLALGGIMIGGAAVGLGGAVLGQSGTLFNLWNHRRLSVKLGTEDGGKMKLLYNDLLGARVRPADGEPGFKLELRKATKWGRKNKTWHEGEEARRFAAAILPKLNASGGKRETVQQAVAAIEAVGHPSRLMADVASGNRFSDKKGVPGYINKMPRPTKLAFEMALHEEQERRALEGELWLLEEAWKEAEEIAAISDALLVPKAADDFVRKYREREEQAERAGD